MNILVAEDNPINQKLIMRMLSSFGYHADLAENGALAVMMAAQKFYPLILMDIQMPEMDGLEATKRIRMHYPAGRQPVIVAVTANALVGDRERFLAAGMDDYLSKPLKFDEFRAHVTRWIDTATLLEQKGVSPMSVPLAPGLLSRLKQLEQETDHAFLLEMIDMYLADAPVQLDRLNAGIVAGDFKAVLVAAHTLKGSTLNIGADDFGGICRRAEESSRAGNLTEIASLEGLLREQFAQLREQLLLFKQSNV